MPWFQRQAVNGLLVYGCRAPRRTGVPQPHISQLERCARDVNVDTLARLLDALFCDLILVPRPRRHFGDLIHEKAEYRYELGGEMRARFQGPNSPMWKK